MSAEEKRRKIEARKEESYLGDGLWKAERILDSKQVDGHTLYLVMDLALGGTLKYHLKKSHPKGFPEAQARFYAAQIASGLQYLHSKLILYRDCKPENM